jgi:hypothetical protein
MRVRKQRNGYKPYAALRYDQTLRLLRENVSDAAFRYLFVGTSLSCVYITDIDIAITCNECLHPVFFAEVTCEKGTVKHCSITASAAARLDKFIAPSAAFVLQIHDYRNCNENYTPLKVTVYWVYLPAKFRKNGYPPPRHFTYEQFRAYMVERFKLLHPDEVCNSLKIRNRETLEGIVPKVVLVEKWEGNRDDESAPSCKNFGNPCSSQ